MLFQLISFCLTLKLKGHTQKKKLCSSEVNENSSHISLFFIYLSHFHGATPERIDSCVTFYILVQVSNRGDSVMSPGMEKTVSASGKFSLRRYGLWFAGKCCTDFN